MKVQVHEFVAHLSALSDVYVKIKIRNSYSRHSTIPFETRHSTLEHKMVGFESNATNQINKQNATLGPLICNLDGASPTDLQVERRECAVNVSGRDEVMTLWRAAIGTSALGVHAKHRLRISSVAISKMMHLNSEISSVHCIE